MTLKYFRWEPVSVQRSYLVDDTDWKGIVITDVRFFRRWETASCQEKVYLQGVIHGGRISCGDEMYILGQGEQ